MKKFLALLITCSIMFPLTPMAAFAAEDAMSPESLFFLEIPSVLIASGKSEKVEEAPANVYVITGKQMEERGYRTLVDLMKDLPGTVWNNREGYTTGGFPIIRGIYEVKRLKLMFNGMVFDPKNGAGTAWQERFPIEGIERVEFILGPYAPLYGRNTFSGVMNVITKSGEDINGFRTSVLTGNYGQLQATGIYGKKVNAWDLYLSLFANTATKGRDMAEENDLYTVAARDADPNFWFNNDLSLNDKFYMPWNNQEVSIKAKHDSGFGADVQYNKTAFTKTGTGLNQYYYVADDNSLSTEIELNARLSYEMKKDEDLTTKTSVIYQDYSWYGKNVYTRADVTEPTRNRAIWAGQEAKSTMIEQTANYNVSEKNALYASASYEEVKEKPLSYGPTGADPAKPTWTNDTMSSYFNLSLQDKITITDPFSIVAGIMYEHSNSYADVVLPRLSLNYFVKDDNVLKLMYSGGYLTPDPITRLTQTAGTGVKGVTDLNPENLTSIEAQYTHKFNANASGNISIYQNTIKDIIAQVANTGADSATYALTYANQGKKTIQGFELNLNAKVFNKAKTFLSYGYVTGKIDPGAGAAEIGWLPVAAKDNIKLGVTVPVLDDKLNVYAHSLYVGEFGLWTSKWAPGFVPSESNTYADWDKLGKYNIIDLALTTTPMLNETWTVSLGVNNVLDTEAYDMPEADDPLFLFPVPLKKRTWTIKVSAAF